MNDTPGHEIARQDEVLELLYWLEGERLGGSATFAGIVRFLAHPEGEVRSALDILQHRGFVVPISASGEFALTSIGRAEAARRFAEEFAPLLSQGHGECNDPACGCHANPLGAAECHARRGALGA